MIRHFTATIGEHAPIEMAFDLDPDNYATDAALQHYFDANQVPEPEVAHLMARVVRPGDVVIDGGANVGFFTVLLSKLVGPAGLVIAVEPSTRNCRKLLFNLAANDCGNVTVCQKALSHDSNPVPFYAHADNGQDSCFGDGEHRTVPAVTLETLALGRIVRLIKLDIEGSEANALRGAGALLQHGTLPFIVCETNCTISGAADSIFAIVRRFNPNFDPFVLSELGGIPALVPGNCVLSPQRMNSNLLFSTLDRVAEAWHEVRY